MARKGYRPLAMSASGLLQTFADSYSQGTIRALAQEPVQNAKDARFGDEVVHVEYRMMRRMATDGSPFYTLAVTDRGTSGLCGKTNPSAEELKDANEEERQQLKWYHFERLFDSNKGALQSGSRGWGKSIFLHCSHIPGTERSAMMMYDTLLRDDEYRLSDITILNDDFGVREVPLLNDEARRAVSDVVYRTPDGSISVPLALEPLSEPGARIIVPYLSDIAVTALRNGSLARWLQYLWWRPIADGRLTITIVDEEQDTCQTIDEPPWWDGEIWSSDATTPGEIHRLYQGCHMQILENKQLGQGCTVKRLALLYDENLHGQPMPDDGPDYFGIQMFHAGQCIETYWDFDFIQPKYKPGLRAFVEFDTNTDRQLRDKEKAQHDGFRRTGIVKNPILPFLQGRLREFAYSIGLITSQDSDDRKPNEKFRRTSQFVFGRLLSNQMGDVLIENTGDNVAGVPDKPWEVDVLLSYPNSQTSRVDWGQRISNIRFVVNSQPESSRRNIKFALEWQAPGEKYEPLWSKTKPKAALEYGLKDRVLTQREIEDNHIICPEPGVYRIRAAVYEDKRLVAKSAKRIHVEREPPERQENPYTVSISVENETTPGELRIENGDFLRLQINGRNRSHDDVSGHLLLRMREGTILVSDEPFAMPSKPLGGDERRHKLHSLRLRVVRGGPGEAVQENGFLTLALEPGRHVMQAYLMDGRSEMAPPGSRTLHFESEPAKTQGGMPFEVFQVHSGTPPMWELRMEESKLRFAPDYPLYTALLQNSAPEAYDGHNPFELEININGLLQWALEPLLEDEADPTRLESLRDARLDLVEDDAWDWYMDCLSELEAEMKNYKQGQLISPIDFALKWRKTVAAIHPILIPQEND